MLKKIICAVCLFTLPVTLARATPPTDIKLEYDTVTKALKITAAHISQSLNKHYIHRAVVTVNGKEPQTFYFTRQTKPDMFEESITLDLQSGDHVHVELTCIKGGVGEANLDAPAADADVEKNESDKKNTKAPEPPQPKMRTY